MGGGTPRAAAPPAPRPNRPPLPSTPAPHSATPAPPTVIPAPPTVIPAQAGTCAGRNPPPPSNFPPSPIHPSPLPGGRLGGGWNAASRRTTRTAPQSPTPSITPARPSPSFLRRQEPATTIQLPPSPIHPSPLPGGRLGGVERREPPHHPHRAPIAHPFHHPRAPLRHPHAPTAIPAPSPVIPAPSPVIPAQAGTTPHPPLPPNPATLAPEQKCQTMPLSPQSRPLRPHATAGNHALANADQTLTEVDTRLTALDARLTKVDKSCQNLTPSTPAPTPYPSKTQQNRSRALHPDTPSVNPRRQPLQRTPNKPEQIRTNLNKPEHRQAPRPDRDTPRITPDQPGKNKPRTPSSPTRNPPLRGEGGGMECAIRVDRL